MIDFKTIERQLEETGRVGLWVNGGYVQKCSSCGSKFIGEKRSKQCLPCAIKEIKTAKENLSKVCEQYRSRLNEANNQVKTLSEALEFYADGCDAGENGNCGYRGNLCCKVTRRGLDKVKKT